MPFQMIQEEVTLPTSELLSFKVEGGPGSPHDSPSIFTHLSHLPSYKLGEE